MMQAYRATMMQAYRATRGGVGAAAMPRRGRHLEALLVVAAILVIVAVMALMTRGVVAPGTGGVGAQDANLKAAGAGSAIVHNDAGNMPATGVVGTAIVHDDAGNVR
jgi:hypothetical protein